ncbi:TATA box-binding protein-associated factor RNA polymerase I subunit B isoform X2 [Lycorma delicatula]|uniref:TATA box-binding protein-associated factor RNA polymerase I subunit B isoform X2 n=1 Tax=Lycorma delicatula TaxID=130591 RepID=UPI003F50D58D
MDIFVIFKTLYETYLRTSQDDLTSWEIFNFVLRGLVDEMITLGADENLKVIVLQLWASYLSRLEVAFKKQSTVHFGLGYKIRDVELLMNKDFNEISRSRDLYMLKVKEHLKRDKKKKKQKKSGELADMINGSDDDELLDINISSSQKQRLTKLKRKLAEEECLQLSQQEKFFLDNSQLQSQSQTLENLTQDDNDNDQPVAKGFYISSHARAVCKTFKSLAEDLSYSKKMKLFKQLMQNNSQTGYNITLAKLIGVLQLGMMFSNQDAQIGDTVRWMSEGHISSVKAERLFPSEVNLHASSKSLLHNKKMTNLSIRESIHRVARVMSIKSVPQPNFFKLTARYCLELQLPDDLLQKVHILLELCPPKAHFTERISVEAQAMSYIVVALKLFFGLDGVTERSVSEYADYVNRKLKTKNDNSKILFSWTNWVKFIECRKTVIAQFHYPTRISLNKLCTSFGGSSVFCAYWRKKNFTNRQTNASNSKFKNGELNNLLNEMSSVMTDADNLEFPPSLTPLVTYTNELLNNHSEKLEPAARNILMQKFTTHLLLLPNKYQQFESDHINLTVHNSRLRSVEEIPLLDLLSLPSVFNNVAVNELIIKTSKKRKRSSDHELSEITNNLLKKRLIEVNDCKVKGVTNDLIDNESIQNVKCKSFLLSKPYKHYWLLHGKFYNPSRPVTLEKFDEIARKMFSSTFLWLLKECCRIINVCPKDLYSEVVRIEVMLMKI